MLHSGSACFICENDNASRRSQDGIVRCQYCPQVILSDMKGAELLRHNGGDILHDPRLKDADNPCGFCLSTDSSCSVRLVKRGKAFRVDNHNLNTNCSLHCAIKIKSASTSMKSSPCSNVPVHCPLCDKHADAIWKYNLRAHLMKVHRTPNVDLYKNSFQISEDEHVLMRGIFRTQPRTRKKKAKCIFRVSEGHSTCVVLW
jgi:hypothetical protein